jgi:hypothetical protein
VRPWLPAAWQAGHVMQQVVVLAVAGVALLAASWRSPVLTALLEQLAGVADPWAPFAPVRLVVPLFFPLVLGVPLVLTRYRAPVLLWLAVMTLVATLAVVEVARLNWAAFVAGVAFRVESGPVPFVRSAAGLVVVLCGVLLLGQQSVQHHLALLAERGVPRGELALVRGALLRRERLLAAGAAGAGVVLLIVAGVSMGLTERPPESGAAIVPIVVWVVLLLSGLAGVLAFLARRRSGAP